MKAPFIYKIKRLYWLAKAYLANLIYGSPSRSLKIIGVTGTNGKTTTCFFIDNILREAGFKTARMTTVDFHLGGTPKPNPIHLTTFGAFQLQKFLKKAKENKIDWVILELSSHGLEQERARGVSLDAGVITYVLREHIDFHKTIENYLEAKARILSMIKQEGFAVLNRDDKNYEFFKKRLSKKVITFGIIRGMVKAERIEYGENKTSFLLSTPKGSTRVIINLPGRFNVSNALAASAVGIGLGIDLHTIKQGLEKMDFVPGRMEEIKEKGQQFKLIVDFVHTPDALALVLESLREQLKGKGRIIIVFGMPGERDPFNRPLMGEIASMRADIVILTNENPRSEPPMEIINQISKGVKGKKEGVTFFKILDREKAIAKAISLAQPQDIVLIAGKGAENYIEFKDKTIPWDDRLVSRKLLKKYLKK